MSKKDIQSQNENMAVPEQPVENDAYEFKEEGFWTTGRRLIGVVICLVLLAALFIIGMVMYNNALQPKDINNTEPIYVTIEEGMIGKEVATLLQDSGVIKNALVFQSYAGRHSKGGTGIQAATYEVSQAMSVPEIYSKLVNGDSYVGQMTSVTFQEGTNLKEMAQIVANTGVCTADEYIAEASNITKYQNSYPILNSIPAESIPERTLEGYLYPDTYSVAGTGTQAAETLIENQLTRFTEMYTPEMLQKTSEAGKTVDEIVILASIVELETKLPEDRPMAASVFYNRMANDMPLQSDITIDYIFGTKTPVLTTEQTQVQSPYNTYINLGLPIGPICSPSQPSMIACIEPAQTNYLYFVADVDTGKLYFNETLDEHNEDVGNYME